MSRRATIRPFALVDIDTIALDLFERAGPDTAVRFATAIAATIEHLREFPGSGAQRSYRHPLYADLHSWGVSGFRSYLIFYRKTADGIEVARVLHGAMDLNRLFDD